MGTRKVVELQELLREKNLTVSGKKDVLLERLFAAEQRFVIALHFCRYEHCNTIRLWFYGCYTSQLYWGIFLRTSPVKRFFCYTPQIYYYTHLD